MRYPLHLIVLMGLPLSAYKGDILSGFWSLVLLCVIVVLCLKNDSDTKQRYPTYAIFSRLCLTGIALAVIPVKLVELMLPYVFIGFWQCVFGGYIGAAVVCVIGMAIHGSVASLFSGTPEHAQAKATRFRWFFDSIPSPFNPDSDVTRHTGYAEPKVKGFKPPTYWKFQCPVCGARVQNKIDVCWNCNYGSDGDSTAYYNKHGIQPPATIMPPEPEPPKTKPGVGYAPITTED